MSSGVQFSKQPLPTNVYKREDLFPHEAYWKDLTNTPLLITKLFLVLILATLIGIIASLANKAKKSDTGRHLKKIKPLGRLALLAGLTIIILAVYIFH